MATLGTFAAGQVLTAAELNTLGAWTSFTPTWTNLTVGNGTVVGRYSQLNDIVFVNIELTWGSTTSASGNIKFAAPLGTPVRISSLTAMYEDAGTRYWLGVAGNWGALGTFDLFHSDAANNGLVNATSPFTWTTNDDMVISGWYLI